MIFQAINDKCIWISLLSTTTREKIGICHNDISLICHESLRCQASDFLFCFWNIFNINIHWTSDQTLVSLSGSPQINTGDVRGSNSPLLYIGPMNQRPLSDGQRVFQDCQHPRGHSNATLTLRKYVFAPLCLRKGHKRLTCPKKGS